MQEFCEPSYIIVLGYNVSEQEYLHQQKLVGTINHDLMSLWVVGLRNWNARPYHWQGIYHFPLCLNKENIVYFCLNQDNIVYLCNLKEIYHYEPRSKLN